jgi:uncharacterized Zn-finger protein
VYGQWIPRATVWRKIRAGTPRSTNPARVHQNCIDTLPAPSENLSIPPIKPIPAKCKHPQVRVVARDEDTEFVECQFCGEVFDAIEYRDMVLEEEEANKADEAV